MSGSYEHVVDNNELKRGIPNPDFGKLLSPPDLCGMIGLRHDADQAFETIEQMFGMIWYLAYEIADGIVWDEPQLAGDNYNRNEGFTVEQLRTRKLQVARELVEEAKKDYIKGLIASPGLIDPPQTTRAQIYHIDRERSRRRPHLGYKP